MLFNSAPFLFAFLPITFSIFFLLGANNCQTLAVAWLATASLVFYGWDNPLRLISIIGFSITFNFVIGWMLVRRPSRTLLAIGIVGDLLLLGYFKYVGFFAETIGVATGVAVPNLNVVLPIGISFFTFTQIAFLVDAARGEAREYKPLHYLLFVTFFPHLIAGPIYHHKEIMPQFERHEIFRFDISNLTLGLTWFAIGFSKKVLLADPIAQYGTSIFRRGSGGQSGWICRQLGRGAQLYIATLFRFFRLLRYGNRTGADDRRQVATQFQFSVPSHLFDRFLAALAHHAIAIPARLPLHPAGRKSKGAIPASRQSNDHNAARRTVAWRIMEFRSLGRASWRWIGPQSCLAKPRGAPPIQSATTCRLGHHIHFCGSCLGSVPRLQPSDDSGAVAKHGRAEWPFSGANPRIRTARRATLLDC